jgi:hypothetical protein
MQADESGASALECLYCGRRAPSTPPYGVMYCDCRYRGEAAWRPSQPPAARAA